jgi:hypothetical protein
MTALAPYFLTAGATLAGVAITGALAELRERRNSREDHANWLRAERRRSYAAMIETGYVAANLYLEGASRMFDNADLDGAKALWPELDNARDLLRIRATDVDLIGTRSIIEAAHGLRRSFRRAPNLYMNALHRLEAGEDPSEVSREVSPQIRSLYGLVNDLVEEVRQDLGINPVTEP